MYTVGHAGDILTEPSAATKITSASNKSPYFREIIVDGAKSNVRVILSPSIECDYMPVSIAVMTYNEAGENMLDNKPSKEQLEQLAKQIKDDQAKTSPAEKRVKIKISFNKAVKKIAQTEPPKKRLK